MESRGKLAESIFRTIMIQGSSAALIFLSGLLLTRVLSPVQFGAYDYVDVWVEILLFFALLGFDRLLILKISVYEVQKEGVLLAGILRFSRSIAISLSILIALGFALWAYSYFSWFRLDTQLDPSELALRLSLLPVMGILLCLRVFVKLNQAISQGFRHIVLAYLPDYVLRPLLLILLSLGFWLWRGLDAQTALLIHSVAAFIALLVGNYFLRRFQAPQSLKTAPTYLTKEWLAAALPFMLISALTLLNLRGGGAILGTISDLQTSALYGVGIRLTALISLALAATSAVLAPRIAALYSQGELAQLQRLVRFSTRMICLVAFPMLLILIFFGKTILGIFGAIYPLAYPALLILCISQIVNVGTGVVGWLVMMTGHERMMALVLTLATAIHILGMLILTPLFQLEGAAMATAVSNIFTNITLTIFSYRYLRINPTIF